MKRLEHFLIPIIAMGILLSSGCEKPGSAMWPSHSFSQTDKSTTSNLTLGPTFKQAEIPVGKAAVYIYRPNPPGGLAGCVAADVGIPFSVKASGKAVTTLVQGGYYAYVTEPGTIEFTAIEDKYSGPLAAKSPFSITVDAKAGQAYYLKGMHRHGIVTELGLALISQEVGAKEIADCKLITTTLGSTSTPTTATQQTVAAANAYGEKIFVGKIEYTSRLSLHIPPGRTLMLSSDKGDKIPVFVSNDIAIRDMKGYPTRIGEKAEVKYSSATNGENEVISFRYVPLDYVQQSTAPVIPAKITPSTQAPVQRSSFQLGEIIPSDKAVVYIYRPTGSGAGGQAIPFGVKANGKVEITLSQGGYYAYVTEPGNIEFSAFEIGFMAPTSQSSVTVDAKAGQVYYLKGAHGKGMGGRARLESVSPETGANEVANCKLITA